MSKESLTTKDKNALVPAKYYRVFFLRLMGLTYEQISKEVGLALDTVNHLFYKKGPLYGLYQEWLATNKENYMDQVQEMMVGNLPDLMRANIMHGKTRAVGAVQARQIVFDYVLGKPVTKVDARVGYYNFADLIKKETLERKKAEEDEKNDEQNNGQSGGADLPERPDSVL